MPNSSAVPKRPAGWALAPAAYSSSKLRPALAARVLVVLRRRSVSNGPGSKPLIVTPWRIVVRATPATKPVRPEAALHHAVDRRLDELDRRQHVGIERLDPVVAVPVAEVARRRAAGIVDDDVGLGARRQHLLAALVGRHVDGDRRHLHAVLLAD